MAANINAFDANGFTKLYAAAKAGNLAKVKELIAAGADLNKKINDSTTPLYIASLLGNLEVIKALIEAGADINSTANDGDTPLYGAVYNNKLEAVKILLAAHPDVNKSVKGIFSPLYLASYNNRIEIVDLLLKAGADIHKLSWKGKSVLQHAEAGTFKNQEIIDLILEKAGKGPKLWKGWSKSDAEKFNVIFNTEPDATGKILANDYACCPVCLKYVERSDACMYMKHKCPDLGGFYHKELYDKYKNADGFIGWCTICGRVALGHAHYKKVEYDDAKPPLLLGVNPFEKDCRLTNGGGGLPEKLARFRALRETAKLLQGEVDKIKEKQALEILVEETWNGPFTKKFLIPGIAAAKKWNINATNFPANVADAPEAAIVYPNIPKPDKREVVKEINKEFEDPFTFETVDHGIEFTHKQPDGTIQTHELSYTGLVEYITTQNTQWGSPDFGKCFANPGCKCHIFPGELTGIIGKEGFTDEIYQLYRTNFNKKFGQVPPAPAFGGRRKLRKTKKAKKQRGGGETPFFTEATNAQCVNPSFEGGRRRKTKKLCKKKSKYTRK